jgi:hypothetical protein
MYVVGCSPPGPPKVIWDVGTKQLPVTVSVVPLELQVVTAGETDETVGAGLGAAVLKRNDRAWTLPMIALQLSEKATLHVPLGSSHSRGFRRDAGA